MEGRGIVVDLPTNLPRIISLDVETYDPFLKTHGPGGVYRDKKRGHLVGLSLAWRDSGEMKSLYLPIGHREGNYEGNWELWLQETISSREVMFAKALYDMEWLHAVGIIWRQTTIRDVQIAEFLIHDSRRSFALNALSQDYLGEEKLTDELADLWKSKGGKGNHYLHMAEFTPEELAPYAKKDTELTLAVYEKQVPILKEYDMWDIWEMESELLHPVLGMRFRGIRVDQDKAAKNAATLSAKETKALFALEQEAGEPVDIWSANSVAEAAQHCGLEYPFTDKDNPSFSHKWLEKQKHPLFVNLLAARKFNRLGTTFIQNNILSRMYRGRIYYNLHTARNEMRGAISGRLSSSNPNLQNIPARDDSMSYMARELFLPEEGEQWLSVDESQAEPRITVHYAGLMNLPGADEAVDAYTQDPDTDYHEFVAKLSGLPRKTAKQLNLAIAYGAQKGKITETLGVSPDDVEGILNQYHTALPFIRKASYACKDVAMRRGYIRTILNRRRHFDLYGPRKWSKGIRPLPYDEAIKEWKFVNRYFVHKALNALIQGSAADLHKQILVTLHREGYKPIVPVHDEVNFSFLEGDLEEEIPRITELMRDSFKLTVPRKFTAAVGKDWGHLESVDTAT